MQAESPRSRGKGFIISDGGFPPEKPFAKPQNTVKSKPDFKKLTAAAVQPLCNAAEGASEIFEEYTSAAVQSNKRFLKSALAFSAAALSAVIFFRFFTIAEAVYVNKEFLGTASSDKNISAALSSAHNYAESIGIENAVPKITTSPVITLKSRLNSASKLKDKLLLSTGKLSETYTLITDGKAIYNAATYDDAKQVFDEYVKSMSMNGEAKAQQDVTIEKRIISASDVKSNSECAAMLAASSHITVISVADTSFDKKIPFETQTTADNTLYIGESVTVSEGKDGISRVSQQTVYENGVEAAVQVLAEEVTAQPVAKVVRVGTKAKNILESGIIKPLDGRLSSPFGKRWGRMHEGIDIAVPIGTPVKAVESGTVCHISESTGGYGKFIKIDHGNGIVTAYAHLNEINVTKNQTVKGGETIAHSGNTGKSTGPHLHFELLKDNSPINPLDYLKY